MGYERNLLPGVPAPRYQMYPRPLSGRETELLQLLCEGLSNAEMAERTKVSVKTIEAHLSRTYAKLGVRSRSQAVAHAIREGMSGEAATG